MSAPCNICGVDWPNHAEACVYVATARERERYRKALEEIVRGGGLMVPSYRFAAKTAREALDEPRPA